MRSGSGPGGVGLTDREGNGVPARCLYLFIFN